MQHWQSMIGWFKVVPSLDEAVEVIKQRKAEIDVALAEYKAKKDAETAVMSAVE